MTQLQPSQARSAAYYFQKIKNTKKLTFVTATVVKQNKSKIQNVMKACIEKMFHYNKTNISKLKDKLKFQLDVPKWERQEIKD